MNALYKVVTEWYNDHMDTAKLIDLGAIDAPSDYFLHGYALVTPDFNGEPIITVYANEVPFVIIDPQYDYEWAYLMTDGRSDVFASTFRQTLVEVWLQVGEINEDIQQEFVAAVGTENEQAAFDRVGEYLEGHPWLSFLGSVVEKVRAQVPELPECDL